MKAFLKLFIGTLAIFGILAAGTAIQTQPAAASAQRLPGPAAREFARQVGIQEQPGGGPAVQDSGFVQTNTMKRFGDVDYYSVAVDGDKAIVGAPWRNGSDELVQGEAHVFVRSGASWVALQTLKASNGETGDGFGISVALDGHTAVIGAAGDAYAYVYDGTAWHEQQRLYCCDPAFSYGFAVALEGDTALIGDPASAPPGTVYVWKRSDGVWTRQQYLSPSDGQANDYFGAAVAVDGDTAIIGARSVDIGDAEDLGAAYVFTRSNGEWGEQTKLLGGGGQERDFFGAAVALDGDTVIIGAPGYDGAYARQGAAYLFTGSGSSWSLQQLLDYPDAQLEGQHEPEFGHSIVIDGRTAMIGAYTTVSGQWNTLYQGAAYVYEQDGSTWGLQQRLVADDGDAEDIFSHNFALDQETAVILADDSDASHDWTTQAYFFERQMVVPAKLRRLAQEFLDEIRDTGEFAQWEQARLGSQIRPLHRPDIADIAYYEFAVVRPQVSKEGTAGEEGSGYIIVSTGEHDHPIAGWDFQGKTPTRALDDLAGDQLIDRYQRLDVIAYVGEDADGSPVAQIADLPGKIVGQTPDMLDQPYTEISTGWIPGSDAADDTTGDEVTGSLISASPGSLEPSVVLEDWDSWQDLKQEYEVSYEVVHEAVRRDAEPQWTIIESEKTVGIDIYKGETHTLDLLPGLTASVAFSGAGASANYTETHVTDPKGGEVRITAVGAEPGRGLPLTLTVTYNDGSLEEHLFYIVDDTAPQGLEIADVEAVDITQNTATITWQTNKAAGGEIVYGPQRGSRHAAIAGESGQTSHSITLTGLAPAATYFFQVSSQDEDGESISDGHAFTTAGETVDLLISNVQVKNIRPDAATITWQANVPASGAVSYGLAAGSYPHTAEDAVRQNSHSVSLTGLTPGVTYYFTVFSEGENGAQGASGGHSFTARSNVPFENLTMLPFIIGGRSPSAAAAQPLHSPNGSGPGPGPGPGDGHYAYWWAAPEGELQSALELQPHYDQLRPQESPNDKDCWTGCTPTGWSMLIGWADRQAASGNQRWRDRTGLYMKDGGSQSDATAPLTMDDGIRNVIWELHGHMATTCKGLSGSTSTADQVSGMTAYMKSRTHAEAHHARELDLRKGGPKAVGAAVDAIVDRSEPVTLDGLNHTQLAFGYAYKYDVKMVCTQRIFGLCIGYRYDFRTDDWFYTNTGWTSNHPDYPRYRWIRRSDFYATGYLLP